MLTNPAEMTVENLRKINPRYVFIPHWSWRVPDPVIDEFECVCFHMTDLPFGRGGSPLQNLILRGISETKISALRMVHDLDAGPVYMKTPLSLEGSAQRILERAADIIVEMIADIANTEPAPRSQSGTPTQFSRRQPDESRLPGEASPQSLYDFIRMLDADTYPRAFLDWGRFRLHFSEAELIGDQVISKVTITVHRDAP